MPRAAALPRATPAARWGALALLVRPAYIATEVVTAAATTGGYSFVADSVSKLGEVGCSDAYCSRGPSDRGPPASWLSPG